MRWLLAHLRKLLPAPTVPAVPKVPTPVQLLARAWSGLEALLDDATAAMESYNQWIIEMLVDDTPRTPSWAVAAPSADAQEEAETAVPSPPASGASSTHWATSFAIDGPNVMLNSLSDSSDEEDDGEDDENEQDVVESAPVECQERAEDVMEEETKTESDEEGDPINRDAVKDDEDGDLDGSDEAKSDEEGDPEGTDAAKNDEEGDPDGSDAGESDESDQSTASDEVQALRAACDFYMLRCDQLRDTVSCLSTDLVLVRAILERRQELELLQGHRARAAKKMVTGCFSCELKRVLIYDTSGQEQQPASAADDSDGDSDGGSEPLSVLQSFVQALESPTAASASDFSQRTASNVASATPASSSPDVAHPPNEAARPTASDPSDEALEEQEIVVPIRPEGTSYQQLTELPVQRDDGNWHRHILQVLKAERELRRQQQHATSDSNADTASFHSTDDDGDDAGGHRRRLVLRSSSSSLSETSNVSLTA